MLDRILHHLPWLGPLLAAGVGAGVGRYGLGGGFWTVLIAALIGGFLPVIALAVWRRFRAD
ncbi:MAG: hypothetical protein K5831_17030 [Brevundimonas sp.]|uniref:hypothetical protein n=1 Tax=Brevundimonas sp. TaxID=1871086 RepID=UPI00258B2045|nr:hypothetical protein [Brevundimonas sp.]MCV0416567.1 hypothetical protein [Brevundimonas sp.]